MAGIRKGSWIHVEFVNKNDPGGRATSTPELEGRGGLYLEDCHIAEINNDQTASAGLQSYAVDPDTAQRLWAVSEEMVRQSFAV